MRVGEGEPVVAVWVGELADVVPGTGQMLGPTIDGYRISGSCHEGHRDVRALESGQRALPRGVTDQTIEGPGIVIHVCLTPDRATDTGRSGR